MKPGDKVIIDVHNGRHEETYGLKTHFGIILSVNDGSYNVLYFDTNRYNGYTNIAYYIMPENISLAEDNQFEISKIITVYNELIEEKKKELKTVSQEEKDVQKRERYENIKYRIMKNCEYCINKDLDDHDFVNRVKEIANLKKQLFSPEQLPCISETHKYNGIIKYRIRKLEEERNKLVRRISDEEYDRVFKDF